MVETSSDDERRRPSVSSTVAKTSKYHEDCRSTHTRPVNIGLSGHRAGAALDGRRLSSSSSPAGERSGARRDQENSRGARSYETSRAPRGSNSSRRGLREEVVVEQARQAERRRSQSRRGGESQSSDQGSSERSRPIIRSSRSASSDYPIQKENNSSHKVEKICKISRDAFLASVFAALHRF